jgi:hypothetical protein
VNPLVKRCFQAQKTFGCAGGSTPNPMETTPRNISGVLMRCEAGFQRLGPNARGAAERSPGGCGSRDLVVVRVARLGGRAARRLDCLAGCGLLVRQLR